MRLDGARYPDNQGLKDWTPLHKEYKRAPRPVRIGWPIIGFNVIPYEGYYDGKAFDTNA